MGEPVTRNPVPSLLRSLMSDHLDPGYAAASSARTKPPGGRDTLILVVGVLLVGCVFGVALSQAEWSSDEQGRSDTLVRVREAEDRAASLDSNRASLASKVEAARSDALRNDAAGASVLTDLDRLEFDAGAKNVVGPGVVVTVSEPQAKPGLSDVSQRERGSTNAVVLDRDLQVVVNSLWVSGAEAVSVGGVRIGPGVTIRQAGGAMLVDNQPVFSPYSIAAIGPPNRLQAQFSVSDAYLRMTGLAQLYSIGFDVSADANVEMQASTVRSVRSAVRAGER